MRSYYADLWQLFGVNALDIWDLPFDEFASMAEYADRQRRESAKNSRRLAMPGGMKNRAQVSRLLDGAPKELRRNFEKTYREAARDASAKARNSILSASSKHAGKLRHEIAETLAVRLSRNADGITVSISAINTRMPPGKGSLPAYADGSAPRPWRHPVYGHKWWVPQDWQSARGWFYGTLRNEVGHFTAAAQKAIDELVAKLDKM